MASDLDPFRGDGPEIPSGQREANSPLTSDRQLPRGDRPNRPPRPPKPDLPPSSGPKSISSEPISPEPISSEPISSEPISSEPISSEPISSEPIPPELAYDREDLVALRQAIQKSHLAQLALYFLDYILRAQSALFEQIHSKKQLPRIIPAMALLCMVLSGLYGLVMGGYNGPLQALSSALKLPLLFLMTAVICVPSLYTFNVMLGQRFRFLQTVALMVITLATTSILLVSLAPIALFFTLTTPDNYQFLLLMHVLIFSLCGTYGVRYLYRGSAYIAFRMEQPLNNTLLRIWIVIYAVVGMQLGWRLRPFIGNQGMPFQWFRGEVDGNFYIAVWRALLNILGA